MDKPLRILAVVNVPWDPRLGAARVWIELTDEWRKAGHEVEEFCLTDAFPAAASSPAQSALRLLVLPQRPPRFFRENSDRSDVSRRLPVPEPFRKGDRRLRALLGARSV